jgi:hypothetical protein
LVSDRKFLGKHTFFDQKPNSFYILHENEIPLEVEMSNYLKFFLVFLGIVAVLALLAIGLVWGVTALVQRTAQQAMSPITDTGNTLATKMAELTNPTPTIIPNPETVIHEIRSLARLETIQYTLEKVITAEQGQNELGFLFGDKLLFVAHGTVIAGVDLARLRPEDMTVNGTVLTVRLPPAEVFVATLDNDKSYVYNRETGLLTKGDTNLETTARQVAEKEILKSAIDDGILKQAQTNAESYLSRMLMGLGYSDVIFVESTPEPGTQVTPTP